MRNRRPIAAVSVLAALAFGAGAAAAAAPTTAATPPAVAAPPATSPKAAPQAEQKAVEILPHRALYRMSLASARNGSKVAGVQGVMAFEWGDACDGWTTEQRFQLRFLYAEGEAVELTTNYATWESKDGLSYRFAVRKTVNGELDEEVRGSATLEALGGAGAATFELPERREQPLPAGTLFPSAHTLAVLALAAAGEPFLARTVFDGADEEGTTEVSAVVGKPAAAASDALGDSLRGQTVWPVRMAFFPIGGAASEPEYEMTLMLMRNGVAESMLIDYGDFSVKAALEKFEALPSPGC